MAATQAHQAMPNFTTLHPTLRDHWTNFEGDLNTQLTDAQRDEYYTDADTHMTSSEGFRASGVPDWKQGQVQQTEQHRLYPLTIPPSGFQSNAPYVSTSSAASTYGTSQGVAQYPSAFPQAPLHPLQTHPGQYHHYNPSDVVVQSASSRGSSGEYLYHSTDPRYDLYARSTHQHQPRGQGEEQYYQTRQYDHHRPYHTDPLHPYTTSTNTNTGTSTSATSSSSSQYAFPVPRYLDPSAQPHPHLHLHHHRHHHHWDNVTMGQIYPEPVSHSQPLGPYVQYGDYARSSARESVAEEPFHHEQQLHLQETWQSFGVYVGSPKPTP